MKVILADVVAVTHKILGYMAAVGNDKAQSCEAVNCLRFFTK